MLPWLRGTASGSHAEDEGEELFVADRDNPTLGRVVLSERTRQGLKAQSSWKYTNSLVKHCVRENFTSSFKIYIQADTDTLCRVYFMQQKVHTSATIT